MENFGIKNMGNTCYMNSVLQSLMSLQSLKDFLTDNKCETKLSNSLKTVICLPYNNSGLTIISPKTLYSSLCEDYTSDFFKSKRQQDAHECLLIFLDMIEKGTSKKLGIFYGSYRSTLECGFCSHSLTIVEDFLSLCLPGIFKNENICDYKCDNCKKTGEIFRSYDIINSPDILCIYANRFSKNLNIKNDSPFNFKERIYNKYNLYSIILHSGRFTGSGHYFAVCKRNGIWLCFNDTVVSPINIDDLQKKDIYMLFYVKE